MRFCCSLFCQIPFFRKITLDCTGFVRHTPIRLFTFLNSESDRRKVSWLAGGRAEMCLWKRINSCRVSSLQRLASQRYRFCKKRGGEVRYNSVLKLKICSWVLLTWPPNTIYFPVTDLFPLCSVQCVLRSWPNDDTLFFKHLRFSW